MDAIRKFLNLNRDENVDKPPKQPPFGNEFRKPVWFDDCESDDELSERKGFQIFTNPMEMQKYFEQQMLEMLKSFEMVDESGKMILDDNVRENFLKPGFEDMRKDLLEKNKAIDTDLDDEIYADQLHSLLQRISPELEKSSNIKPYVEANKRVKKTDEETIWDRIHGTFVDDAKSNPPKRNQQQLMKKLPHPRGGVFEGAFQGPKVFRQSVMTQVVRKPDGSTETRRTVRDAEGNENTTVTKRTNDGKVETFSYPGNGSIVAKPSVQQDNTSVLLIGNGDRNVFVTKDGYTIPKLW